LINLSIKLNKIYIIKEIDSLLKMELVVVNGANAIARGVISRLAGKQYQRIKLLDFRPYRHSVYEW
jgi:hypothetical protein